MISERLDQTIRYVAEQTGLGSQKVRAVVELVAEGATVPFIARYRKERTGGLDEVQIRAVSERAAAFEALFDRREVVLQSIESQGKLTDELSRAIAACRSRVELEDLYLPFRPKRRTRASMAREKGLEPLAVEILEQPRQGSPKASASRYLDPDKGVADVDAALQGARDIVAEVVCERSDVRQLARERMRREGRLVSKRAKGAADGPTKFDQYLQYDELLSRAPSHRILAVFRGEADGVLRAAIELEPEAVGERILRVVGEDARSPFRRELREATLDGLRRLLLPSLEKELRGELKERADREAVEVFAKNLRNALLAAPFGEKVLIGVDPGQRTGCKCVVVGETGTPLAHETLYLHRSDREREQFGRVIAAWIERYRPALVVVGNGTGGRETEAFLRELVAARPGTSPTVMLVSEVGASVYSASEIARAELPDFDVSMRGAVSIARRVQDPLAELVKIDPQSVGLGQYQHDVDHKLLTAQLQAVVEDCVNHVGVDLNTASPALLQHVAGVGPALARRIVAHRDGRGRFASRKELLAVQGLGPKTFEQAAGFLRVRDGDNPLDASAVHPERYRLVERIAADLGLALSSLVGNAESTRKIDPSRYVGGDVGEPTLRDIIAELARPGRDPRESFEPIRYRDDVNSLDDLRKGMSLVGVVTNVTAFGAFVDLGVKQDGLVHISQLADRYVRDPHDVVAVGDRVSVRVLDVDLARRRISLTMKAVADG
ncbi:MAG: RNA-binding transcriptional accessory protein [Myxococcales bacterium]|nr:RNA-binding transcriptional accessory protein [Myxococcales bacterium]